MFTRLIQKKRPRKSAVFAIGAGMLVAAGLLTVTVLGALLTDSGTVNVLFGDECGSDRENAMLTGC